MQFFPHAKFLMGIPWNYMQITSIIIMSMIASSVKSMIDSKQQSSSEHLGEHQHQD